MFSISSSDKYVAMVEHPGSNILKLYHRGDSSLSDIKLPLPEKTLNLLFLPDGTLLVSGVGLKKTLCRYRLSEIVGEPPELMWSCDLHDPNGLALADNNIIFVSRWQAKVFTLVTLAGISKASFLQAFQLIYM